MASLAQTDKSYHPAPQTGFDVARFLVTDRQFQRPNVEMKEWTGLRSRIRLQFSGELEPEIHNVIARIAEFESREVGWDSYGGHGLNDKTVHPAFRLIVDGAKMCHVPRIQLNGMGELDIIWESDSRYLEVTAHPNGMYDISFEDIEADDVFESPEPVDYTVARGYLTRFCSIA